MRAMTLQSFTWVVGFAMIGCANGSTNSDDTAQGGSLGKGGTTSTNGSVNRGGAGTGGVVANNGGQTSSGLQTGGSATGGVSAGDNFGGKAAGGADGVGGNGNGGVAVGTTSGNATAGGNTTTGGKAAGGNTTTGGKAAGGNATAGKAAGGNATAGSATGGKAAGGNTTTGGKAAGGTAGGETAAGGGLSSAGSPAGCTPPETYTNLFVSLSGHTQEESDAKVAAAWTKLFNPSGSGNIYFNGPGSDESYVKDIYNGDVRTEGMSYGMIAAVQLDHQTEFDRLWTWVRNHMAQNCTTTGCTGQIAWSCSTSGSKNSTGGAPDGEEYMATALIFASKRWGDDGKYNYAKEAQWVLDLIRKTYFNSQYHLVQFVANSGNVDASYVLPAFYQVWACFDTVNSAFWDASVKAARNFFHDAIDKGTGVIGDRSSFTGAQTQGPGADTIRCVMNIMMDHNFFDADPWQTETYAKTYGAYMKTQNPYTAQMSCNSLLGFGLPAADGKPFVDKLWSAGIPSGNYWDGTLYMLAMLHVSGTFKLWY